MTCALPLLKAMAVDCTGSRNCVFNLISTGPDFLLAVGSHEAGLPMWPVLLAVTCGSCHLWRVALLAFTLQTPSREGEGKRRRKGEREGTP